MTESNETPIGAVRTDYTEKPEATLLRAFAKFAPALQEHLRDPQQPPVAIITSQAAQYSVMADFQLEAQRRAVRALAYSDHIAAYMIAENQISRMGSPKLAILPSPQALSEPAWTALLKYVDSGGNLLITGAVERDEHWQIMRRAQSIGAAAGIVPLTYHNANLRLDGRLVPLQFGQQQQNWLEAMRFEDGSSWKEYVRGKGRIFWAADPVELSEDLQATEDLYGYVCARLNISPMFTSGTVLPPGVLIFPTALADSMLYVLVSDSSDNASINIRDIATGADLTLTLPAEHAALAVISRKEKKIVARYGF